MLRDKKEIGKNRDRAICEKEENETVKSLKKERVRITE